MVLMDSLKLILTDVDGEIYPNHFDIAGCSQAESCCPRDRYRHAYDACYRGKWTGRHARLFHCIDGAGDLAETGV